MDKVQEDLLPLVTTSLDWDSILGRRSILVCALSGGPDSIALCDLLLRLSSDLGFSLAAAHLNHGIRGDESDKDEAFVRDFCTAKNLPLVVEKADVPQLADSSDLSIEMAARSARYDFLERAAGKFDSTVVAIGHNANDRVENLLMRLLRGSGGRGLGSLQPVRRQGNLTLVRPLLEIFRHQILAYLDWRGLEYRVDSTNLDENTDRGRIRNRLLPGLLKLAEESGWEKTLESLARSAALLSDDESLLNAIADEHLPNVSTSDDGSLQFPIEKLGTLPSPILARLILSALERSHPSFRPEREHVNSIIDMLAGRRTGPCDIPGGLRAEPVGDNVTVRRPTDIPQPGPIEIPLDELPTVRKFGPYEIEIALLNPEEKRTLTSVGSSQGGTHICLPPGCHSIIIRSMQPGDRMSPLGMQGHSKKIADIFTDRKVPRENRSSEPLVISRPDGAILAIPRLGIISETAKVTPESGSVIRVSV